MTKTNLEWALAYIQIQVTPGRHIHIMNIQPMRDGICGCGKPQCPSPGKHPIEHDGLNSATCDPEEVIRRWTANPDASIAIACAKSGLFILDVDIYHDDLNKIRALEELYGELPITPVQMTGSHDGYHFFFLSPILDDPSFQVRGLLGGVIGRSAHHAVVAPSNHKSGNFYGWLERLGLTEIPIAKMPPAWVEAWRKTPSLGDIGVPKDEPAWLAAIPQEQRIVDARKWLETVKPEIKGQSKAGTTFDVARHLIKGFAIRDPEIALLLMEEYDKKCIPPWGARIGRHVWSAYNKAQEPEWGHAYRGEKERRSIPPVDDMVVMAHLEGIKRKRSDKPDKILEKNLISMVLDKQYLGDKESLVVAALANACPPGTTDSQLTNLLIGCNMSDQRAEDLVRTHRLANASKITHLGDLIPDEVVIAGHNYGPPVTTIVEMLENPDQAGQVTDAQKRRASIAKNLRLGDDGFPANRPNNINLILSEDPDLKGQIRFNELTKSVEFTCEPYASLSANTVHIEMMNYIDRMWGLNTDEGKVKAQLLLIARKNEYNPVAEYLRSLKWDGKRRLDTWLIDYCVADDNEFNRRVGAMWMIAAVARAIVPGAKVDTVLVLEGKQAAKKSTTFSTLGGAWFSDSPLVFGNKDSLQMASFCWIIELAELASLRQSETESQKAFLSAKKDTYRPPYGSAPENFMRFAVFGGSTNDDEYLVDPTGNRRYWPVRVNGRANILQMIMDRDQLWAEAMYRYSNASLNPHLADKQCPGERWWFETDDEEDMARGVVASRRPENIWASKIREWAEMRAIGGKDVKATLADIAQQALGLDTEKTYSKHRAISAALKDAGFVQCKGPGGRPMWEAPRSLIEAAQLRAERDGVQPPATN